MFTFAEYIVEEMLHGLWYHGTSSMFIPSIKREGLKPNPGKGAWEWAQKMGMSIPAPENGVYITKKRQQAATYAIINAHIHGGRPNIITLDIRKDVDAHRDKDDAENDDTAVSFVVPQKLSPECILRIDEPTRAEMQHFQNGNYADVEAMGGINSPEARLAALGIRII